MPLTVASQDRTWPARFDEHINHAILVAKYRVEEFFDDSICMGTFICSKKLGRKLLTNLSYSRGFPQN
jgi:hypothetical protein